MVDLINTWRSTHIEDTFVGTRREHMRTNNGRQILSKDEIWQNARQRGCAVQRVCHPDPKTST